MYSESNYNSFKERLLQINLENEENNKNRAKEYAHNRSNDSKHESEEFFDNSMKELKKEIITLKKKKIMSIELNYIRKRHLLIKKQTYRIRHMLKNELLKQFDSLSECFLSKICKNFDKGNLKLYKHFENKDLKKFKLDYINEQKIIFTEGNRYIEFSVELILREYQPIIKEKILGYLGE